MIEGLKLKRKDRFIGLLLLKIWSALVEVDEANVEALNITRTDYGNRAFALLISRYTQRLHKLYFIY